MRYILCTFLFFIGKFICIAQERTPIVVMEISSLKSIEYATVVNLTKKYRAVTNVKGEAVIKGTDNDSLLISCLGYQVKYTTFKEVVLSPSVTLAPINYLLKEVNVNPRPDIKILLQACKTKLASKANRIPYEQTAFLNEIVYEFNRVVGYCNAKVNIYNGGYADKYKSDAMMYLGSDVVDVFNFRRSTYPTYFEIDYNKGRFVRFNIPNVLSLLHNKKNYLHRRLFTDQFFEWFNFKYEDELLEDRDGALVYKISFTLKKEYEKKAIMEHNRLKNNHLFKGYLLINPLNSNLLSFHINQDNYQYLLREKFPIYPAITLDVGFITLEGKSFLSYISQKSDYNYNGLSFRIADELSITSQIDNLNVDKINQRPSRREEFQVSPQKPRAEYLKTDWTAYNYLLTEKIKSDLENEYKEKLEDQFKKERTIYSNIK